MPSLIESELGITEPERSESRARYGFAAFHRGLKNALVSECACESVWIPCFTPWIDFPVCGPIMLMLGFADARIEIINVGGDLLEQGLVLLDRRHDKEWSLTDRVSFEVMAQFGLVRALTADAHFEQAEFVALLRA